VKKETGPGELVAMMALRTDVPTSLPATRRARLRLDASDDHRSRLGSSEGASAPREPPTSRPLPPPPHVERGSIVTSKNENSGGATKSRVRTDRYGHGLTGRVPRPGTALRIGRDGSDGDDERADAAAAAQIHAALEVALEVLALDVERRAGLEAEQATAVSAAVRNAGAAREMAIHGKVLLKESVEVGGGGPRASRGGGSSVFRERTESSDGVKDRRSGNRRPNRRPRDGR
jgi:hypothetical protein